MTTKELSKKNRPLPLAKILESLTADIIIGAPGAKEKSSGKSRRTGKVYVVYGEKP